MNETDDNARPVLVGLEETPELVDCWQAFFMACWDAYELLKQRRQAAATATGNRINDQAQEQRA